MFYSLHWDQFLAFKSGHTTYQNTGILLKYWNTREKYQNILDFINIHLLCCHKKYKSEKTQNIYFFKTNYAEITSQAYILKYMFGFKRISMRGPDLSITKLWENDTDSHISKNERPISLKYEQQYVHSWSKVSKTSANRINLDFLCIFSTLVNSAAKTRIRI